MQFIAFARNEVAFVCSQIKATVLRFIPERISLNFVTACDLRYLGILVILLHFSG